MVMRQRGTRPREGDFACALFPSSSSSSSSCISGSLVKKKPALGKAFCALDSRYPFVFSIFVTLQWQADRQASGQWSDDRRDSQSMVRRKSAQRSMNVCGTIHQTANAHGITGRSGCQRNDMFGTRTR